MLGQYSLVRFYDEFSDQQINLGVIVWDEKNGFIFKIRESLDIINLISPDFPLIMAENQIGYLSKILTNPEIDNDGKRVLIDLSNKFCSSVIVDCPYPTKIQFGVKSLLNKLFREHVPSAKLV